MRRFFWNGESEDESVIIKGDEARHISKVLRIQEGEQIILCDGQCNDFIASVERIESNSVNLKLLERVLENNEPSLNATLYLAYTKGERLDYAVQKSVELGAGEICLFASKRCITSGNDRKLERLNRISVEASKQSNRSKLVKVTDGGSFSEVLLSAKGLKLFCYENETVSIRTIMGKLSNNVSIMFGPEGGFEDEEAKQAIDTGWRSVSLGKRILRAETAPVAALSILMYQEM